jgi:hypothetical protein
MSAQYQYVKIGRPYLCLQQNPVVLAWFLCFQNKSLRLSSLGFSRKKALKAVKTFVRHQLRLRSNASTLELPVYGNLCLPVHRGYKVFNFRRKTVVRIFAPEVDTATVESEIESVRKAGLLDFAPNVRRWNIKDRWYEEDFVIGYRGSLISKSEPAALSEYHQDIAPCIERMILLQAPLSMNLGEYVKKTIEALEDNRLSKQELDVRKVNTIKSFVESMTERLYLEGDCQVDLVFSHGDFSLVNILRTRDGIMVIDWESAGRRNTLFDLYNYFFTELYYERATTNLVSEINEAISSLQSLLALEAPDIARTLPSLAPMYRRLYYFERVFMLLERELSNKQLDVILRSIEVFNRYEETIASGHSSVREGNAPQK